jgi:hypothetical protein
MRSCRWFSFSGCWFRLWRWLCRLWYRFYRLFQGNFNWSFLRLFAGRLLERGPKGTACSTSTTIIISSTTRVGLLEVTPAPLGSHCIVGILGVGGCRCTGSRRCFSPFPPHWTCTGVVGLRIACDVFFEQTLVQRHSLGDQSVSLWCALNGCGVCYGKCAVCGVVLLHASIFQKAYSIQYYCNYRTPNSSFPCSKDLATTLIRAAIRISYAGHPVSAHFRTPRSTIGRRSHSLTHNLHLPIPTVDWHHQ